VSDAGGTRLAVLGSPIAHSKSPAIQRAAYRRLGLPWTYEAIDIAGGDLAAFVRGRDESWRGLSLTMPLKRDILPLLSSRHPLVDRVGAANTVLFTPGSGAARGVRGFNTDVRGSIEALRSVGVSTVDTAVILGAGATAASVLVALSELGARRVVVHVRTPHRARDVQELGIREGVEVLVRSWGSAVGGADDENDATVVVSTVPGGAEGIQFAPELPRHAVLFDVAYDPWPTRLAADWGLAGGCVVSGLELLLQQAVGQIRVFVSGDPEHPLPDESSVLEAMRTAVA
jgi:shikimate dehydrogenase